MAESKTSICNKALGHLAITKQFANVDTDTSVEATACNLFYEQARDECLRDFPWPWATRIAALSGEASDPNDEWGYSYSYPANVASISRIFSGYRPESSTSRIPYRIISSGTANLILTNQNDAYIEYIQKITDVTLYPPDFIAALTLKIAAYIAPMVTGGDPGRLGLRALQLYDYAIQRARTNAANESQPEQPAESDFINVR